MLLFRKILFYVFVVLYLVICPLLILYALGYVYNPLKEGLIRTGVIHLSTTPSGASVYLEQSRYTQTTPTVIEGLLPGTYQISIEKSGYKRWTQSVSLEAGKAVAFNSVLLIPEQWPITYLSDKSYDTLFPIPDTEQFLLSDDSTLESYFLYDKDESLVPLLDSKSAFAKLDVKQIDSVIGGKNLIVATGAFWNKSVLLINPTEQPAAGKDITVLFNGELPDFCWQGEEDSILYILRNQTVSRVNLKTQQVTANTPGNLKGFGVDGEWLYMITPDGEVVRRQSSSQETELLFQDSDLVKRLFDRSDFYRIKVYEHKLIVFLGDQGDLILNIPPYTAATEDVINFEYNEDEKLLLFWMEDAIQIADCSNKSDETVFFERFSVRSVYENAKNIKHCFWAWRDSHLLCDDADTMFLIEIEPQGSNHVEPVCNLKRRTNVYYDADEHTLYYLAEDTGELASLQIVP